jgi:hypothetical protein
MYLVVMTIMDGSAMSSPYRQVQDCFDGTICSKTREKGRWTPVEEFLKYVLVKKRGSG